MVGHQDEIAPCFLQHALDFFERHLRIVGDVGVAMTDPLVVGVSIIERYIEALRLKRLPGPGLGGEPDEAVE